jgi:hypothetical protein
MVTDVQAAEIAVGSLVGIAPSRIMRHILIVVDQDRDLSMVTSCCKHELAQFIGQAHLTAVIRAVEPGPCYHEGGEQS